MKSLIINTLLAISLLGSGCAASSGDPTESSKTPLRQLQYDMTADMNLFQILEDLSILSTRQFAIDPELQEMIDEYEFEPSLPNFVGFNADDVLDVMQASMPPEIAFEFQDASDNLIVLLPRFQPNENTDAAGITIIGFDTSALILSALSFPADFEEDCGGTNAGDFYLDDPTDTEESYLDDTEEEEPEGQIQLGEEYGEEYDEEYEEV